MPPDPPFTPQERRFEEKMAAVNDTMRSLRLPQEMSRRVRNYFTFVHRRSGGRRQEDLLYELNKSLHADISIYLHRDMLLKVPLFQGCDPSFMFSIMLNLQLELYLAGDTVCMQVRVGERRACWPVVESEAGTWRRRPLTLPALAQGEIAKQLYFVASGILRVMVMDEAAGEMKEVNTLHDGAHFGDIGLILGGHRRTATVQVR